MAVLGRSILLLFKKVDEVEVGLKVKKKEVQSSFAITISLVTLKNIVIAKILL